MIVQVSDFVDEFEIPNTDNEVTNAQLERFIDKYENEILRETLGASLATELLAGLADTDTLLKWVVLRDLVKPAIVGFVYYWWMRKQVTTSTPLGETKGKSQNSVSAWSVDKMVFGWNAGVDAVYKTADAIVYAPVDYGNYYLSLYNYRVCGWNSRRLPAIFTRINALNI